MSRLSVRLALCGAIGIGPEVFLNAATAAQGPRAMFCASAHGCILLRLLRVTPQPKVWTLQSSLQVARARHVVEIVKVSVGL